MPKYTKRHYEDIAYVLSEAHWTIVRHVDNGLSKTAAAGAHAAVDTIRDQFITLFTRDNDRFQFDRFVIWSNGKAPR